MQSGLVRSLDLDDVTRSPRGVVKDVLVALDHVQVVVRYGLHVKPPAGVATGTKGVVDHIADSGDSQVAHTIDRAWAHGENFVIPKKVRLFCLGNSNQVAVDTVDGWTGGESKNNFADNGVRGFVVKRVERDDLMAETLQSPETIKA